MAAKVEQRLEGWKEEKKKRRRREGRRSWKM